MLLQKLCAELPSSPLTFFEDFSTLYELYFLPASFKIFLLLLHPICHLFHHVLFSRIYFRNIAESKVQPD